MIVHCHLRTKYLILPMCHGGGGFVCLPWQRVNLIQASIAVSLRAMLRGCLASGANENTRTGLWATPTSFWTCPLGTPVGSGMINNKTSVLMAD